MYSRTKLRKNLSVERPNIQLIPGESSLHPPSLTSADPIPSARCILNPSMIKNSWWNTPSLILNSSTGTEMSFRVVWVWNEAQLCNILFQRRRVTGRSKRNFHHCRNSPERTAFAKGYVAFALLMEITTQHSSVTTRLEKFTNNRWIERWIFVVCKVMVIVMVVLLYWQVLELLCQILQTDSLTTVQQWLLLAGQRGKMLLCSPHFT